MEEKSTLWQRFGLQNWFLSSDSPESEQIKKALTPDDVYKYIIEKFKESVGQLSFANRVVFFHEFIICFNQDDYREFMDNKKGIFGLIVQ